MDNANERKEYEEKYGKVWNTQELQQDFNVLGFMAPFVVVANKTTGEKGSLQFNHMPRYYYNYRKD